MTKRDAKRLAYHYAASLLLGGGEFFDRLREEDKDKIFQAMSELAGTLLHRAGVTDDNGYLGPDLSPWLQVETTDPGPGQGSRAENGQGEEEQA